MATYTLVDPQGNPVNLIVVEDIEEYPLQEGWTLQDPKVWQNVENQFDL